MTQMLRQSGKKLFVATNSLWDYTHVVMNWVLEGKKGADRDESWLQHFDAVRRCFLPSDAPLACPGLLLQARPPLPQPSHRRSGSHLFPLQLHSMPAAPALHTHR